MFLNSKFKIQYFIFIIILIMIAFSIAAVTLASGTANLQIRIVNNCGNGVKDSGEQCDGTDLGGATCVSMGYSGGGTLRCYLNCSFNTSSCVPGGGGGGGGGGGLPPTPVASVIFSGRAYPLSKVGILKDGQLVMTTVAGPDANFSISLSGLSSGNYLFGVFGEDNKGQRSSLFTFPVYITQGATTQVSGIFIAPTIAVDKSTVKQGDNISIFGQSAPNSQITIAVNSEKTYFETTTADAQGTYLYNFDSAPLEMGDHSTKSKSAFNNSISSFGKLIHFAVGTENILSQTGGALKGDLNHDGFVNLVDFSILAYWYKRPSPPAADDLNNDGKIDIVDFSIMAYYWTG